MFESQFGRYRQWLTAIELLCCGQQELLFHPDMLEQTAAKSVEGRRLYPRGIRSSSLIEKPVQPKVVIGQQSGNRSRLKARFSTQAHVG